MACDLGVWTAGVEASTVTFCPVRVFLTLGNEATRSPPVPYLCAPTVRWGLGRSLLKHLSFPAASLLGGSPLP